MNHAVTLIAEAAQATNLVELVMRPETLVFLIPITAIIGGIAYKITTAIIAHRERMAKIEHGIDPNEPPRAQ
jgi:hypothetical protein